MRTVFLLIALIFSIQSAQANKTVSGEVARIYPNGSKISFRLKNDSCIAGNQYYYFDLVKSSGVPSEVAQAWHSLLLSAAVAGGVVSVSIGECSDQNHVPVRYIYQDF